MKVLKYAPGTNGKFVEEEIPADAQDRAQEFRQQVMELIAETDEALLNTYLEMGTLSPDEMKIGLETGIRQRKIFPLLCVSATQNIGLSAVLDVLMDFAPAPQDRGPVAAKDGHGTEVTVAQDPAGQPVHVRLQDRLGIPCRRALALPRVQRHGGAGTRHGQQYERQARTSGPALCDVGQGP